MVNLIKVLFLLAAGVFAAQTAWAQEAIEISDLLSSDTTSPPVICRE